MKKGFTLIELIVVTLIFSIILAAMAAIYSTAHKHMFQDYRASKVKGDAMIAYGPSPAGCRRRTS
jgi:prepilin-type N-terminal cleavage/methylation domain-containing protein